MRTAEVCCRAPANEIRTCFLRPASVRKEFGRATAEQTERERNWMFGFFSVCHVIRASPFISAAGSSGLRASSFGDRRKEMSCLGWNLRPTSRQRRTGPGGGGGGLDLVWTGRLIGWQTSEAAAERRFNHQSESTDRLQLSLTKTIFSQTQKPETQQICGRPARLFRSSIKPSFAQSWSGV